MTKISRHLVNTNKLINIIIFQIFKRPIFYLSTDNIEIPICATRKYAEHDYSGLLYNDTGNVFCVP